MEEWQNEKVNYSFSSWDNQHGLLYDYTDNRFPVELFNHTTKGSTYTSGNELVGHYIYIRFGEFALSTKQRNDITLTEGMFASVGEMFTLTQHTEGQAMLIKIHNEKPYFYIGGPIEPEGRLKYIDGCTDSLLISPTKLGKSCFNHLHFPSGIDQTMHTHPSMRVGMVAKGSGNCITPFGEIELYTGQVFIIHEETGKRFEGIDKKMYLEGSHCFQTFDGEMDVIAFHPDSDYGPQDEEHPMINRTIVDGVSAKYIDEIRTK
tara:strand:- start:1086 stop:1871 length:786 start_codon:yes stop_codon:yes gene_type:complete